MSNRQKRKNTRQHDLRVVARGVRRAHPDIDRIADATLRHYLAIREHDAQAVDAPRHHDRQGDRHEQG